MYENSFTLRKMWAPYAKPLSFGGRSTRTELLGYLITFWLISTLFSGLAIALGAAGIASVSFEAQSFMTIDLFNFLLWLPFPALAVRRLHDQNKSGWWAAPLILSTILSWVSGWNLLSQPVRIAFSLLYLIVIVLLFWKPTDGENSYGPDPRLNPDDSALAT